MRYGQFQTIIADAHDLVVVSRKSLGNRMRQFLPKRRAMLRQYGGNMVRQPVKIIIGRIGGDQNGIARGLGLPQNVSGEGFVQLDVFCKSEAGRKRFVARFALRRARKEQEGALRFMMR